MNNTLSEFQPQKPYLICVDSDGCAMDTMDIKHFRCFGPCMVEEWGLHQWEQPILTRWNEINLYTMTRGINRFKGLATALSEVNETYCPIEDLSTLVSWVDTTNELSNESLQRAIAENPTGIALQKALLWSQAVNDAITRLPSGEVKPFDGVLEALQTAHTVADIAIVSSANKGAVLEEWERFGLLPHTDVVMAQDAGTKAYCIGELLKKGYDKEKVLMCGDAPGDQKAAEKNGVLYYPILVGKEKDSWSEFVTDGLPRLLNGTFAGDYQTQKADMFLQNLGGK